jgi:hypothetical protein
LKPADAKRKVTGRLPSPETMSLDVYRDSKPTPQFLCFWGHSFS